ncbi:hypothetical protein SPACI_028340 [Sporomusa acidovorans DSM 3132]|uniref:InsA N-terminal domain-containing protein n=1 Tax=Sporomusa acidovorans (strain ATCC 49682 / DSM 3132 / Mol) TaxID=1123286 RepID=A0ABZ3J3Y3_SPOA4|nr:hypothetical protein SPACI_26740 [Sporomusa acidovorans DSM 3132]SDD39556.1 hypothetical protein SAMN04488499_1001110 [Sporomusa acidovorans]
MALNRCSCGSKFFENVDVTPAGVKEKRYFTRCKQCGLVIAAHGCRARRQEHLVLSYVLHNIGWLPGKVYHMLSR